MGVNKNAEGELRKDLKKARYQLKQYETRIKNIEEEHKQQLFKLSGQDKSPRPEFSFKAQFELLQKQVGRERHEYKRRLDKLEAENYNLKTDKGMLKKDFDEINCEKESLLAQLSASQEQIRISEKTSVHKISEDNNLKDQLIENIEKLTLDNTAVRSELSLLPKSQQESKLKYTQTILQLQTQVEEQKQNNENELENVKFEKTTLENSLNDSREYFEQQIKSLVIEKNTFEEMYNNLKKHNEEEVSHFKQLADKREEELESLQSEVMKIKEDLISQEPKHKAALEDEIEKLRVSENEVSRLEGELAISQLAAQTAEAQAKILMEQHSIEQIAATGREEAKEKELYQTKENLIKIQKELGQAHENAASLDGRFKQIEGE